ncbi:MAG: AI-2E family transporter [Planctomycetota bacterium]|nr:AI-2E family transporter [Planctomycetota bacterium]
MAKRSSRKKTASSRPRRAADQGDSGGSPQTTPPAGSGKDENGAAPPHDALHPMAHLHIWQIQAVRDVLVVAAAVALFWAGYALRTVTVPLLVALLLAYLFEPLIRRLSRHPKVSRAGAVLSLLISVGAAFIIVLALSLPLVVGQSIQFIDDIRGGVMRQRIERLERWVPAGARDEFDSLINQLPAGPLFEATGEADAGGGTAGSSRDGGGGAAGPPDDAEDAQAADDSGSPPAEALPDDGRLEAIVDARVADRLAPLREDLARLQQQIDAAGRQGRGNDGWALAQRGLRTIGSIIGSLIGFGLIVFLIPFFFFFFSLWYPDVIHFGETLVPKKNKERVLDLLKKMDEVVAGFVRGRIVISIIMGMMLAIGWLICGVPYAIPLGLIVGVFCAVPYLGGIGIPAAVGLLLIEYVGTPVDEREIWLGWFGVLLWPTLVFAIVQLIEGYVLIPVIAGKATKLDPVTIVVVVLAGGSVLGVYGMLLAIPVAACGKILFMEVLLPKIRAWTKGEIEDPLPIERD